MSEERLLLSGNEAIARAALDMSVRLGTGYPGTPSTEILEHFSDLGGRAQWAPNEKVALEVGLGAAYGNARTLVTMKHVGLNVAADPLFTAAYTGVTGALVLAVADDPGMASSQNEQDSRRYAEAAAVPMLEPGDSQEAYDFMRLAVTLSERWKLPVLLRLTTRICHSKTVVRPRPPETGPEPAYVRDIQGRVMIPAYARPAHRRLREKLAAMQAWNEAEGPNMETGAGKALGIVTAGVAAAHAAEAAPEASILKIGMTHPLPLRRMAAFAERHARCVVIEEGDPVMETALRADGTAVEGKPAMYRFGELNVARVRRLLAGDTSPEPVPPRSKPPELCKGCPHRTVFAILRDHGAIVTGDIGCYTLSVLPPFEAMDTCVCMGASLGVGLGLRHVLPEDQARRVVSVIGDSTFMHSGITGLVEMAYNRPSTGHLLVILDNGTTAMTGLQDHPGTGRHLDRTPSEPILPEDLARACGIRQVQVIQPHKDKDRLEPEIVHALESNELSVIIVRQRCVLAAGREAKARRVEASEIGGTAP